MRDLRSAIETSTPQLRKANETQETIMRLLHEANDSNSGLTPEERAARRREADDLWEQLRGEKQAARRPMDELQARHPRWIR